MSIFDIKTTQSHQFLKRYSDLTLEDPKDSICSGVFSIKIGKKTGFKTKFINVINYKITIASVFFVFLFVFA